MKFAFAPLVAFATAAIAATNGPYGIGSAGDGIEKGVLNTTVKCNVSILGILPFGTYDIGLGIYATLPNNVNANQPFNILAAARLLVPANLNGLASIFGARYYGGKATKIEVNAKNSDPALIDAAKALGGSIAIPQAPLIANGVSVLEVPGNGKTFTVGPFKGADASKTSNVILSIGALEATINTFDANRTQTFITAVAKCGAPNPPTSLAFVAAGGQGSTATITPKGDGNIKTVDPDVTAGVIGLTYNCDFSGFVQGKVRVSVGGVKKGNKPVASGSPITISQGQGNVYLSQSLISEITSRFDNAKKFAVQLDSLDFLAENATPATLNGLPNGYKSSKAALSSKTVITVPQGAPSKTLPDISFTAGQAGTTALISLGGVSGVAYIYTQEGDELLNIAFTCPALEPATALLPFDIV